MTFEEENTIRYVSVFVLKSLKEGEKDEGILHGINYLININNESKSGSVSDMWVKEIRGGLTNITKEAHQVFLSIEFAIGTHNLYEHNENC